MWRLDFKVPISEAIPACRTILLSIILTAMIQSTLDDDTKNKYSEKE